MLLLQKFNDISGKVLKPKKIQPPASKKKLRPFFIFSFFLNWDFDLDFRSFEIKKIFSPQKCKLELCMSKVSKFWFICLFYSKRLFFSCCCNSKQTYGCYDQKLSFSDFILFYTPSPWLTRIWLTRISLTRIFKKFPFLT